MLVFRALPMVIVGALWAAFVFPQFIRPFAALLFSVVHGRLLLME
jgi:hypothetical protein